MASNAALQGALVRGLVEFPGGELSVGAGEPSGDGVVDGGRGDGGEGFAVEGVVGPGEVEVVGGLAAGDVDVGLGSGGGGVDAAGGDGSGGALDGVGGDGVGVVEAEVSSPAPGGGAVFVEVAAGHVDGADAVERDGDRVVDRPGTGVQREDSPEGAVADVGVGLAGRMEVPVGHAGDDAVADGEATVAAGGDLVAGRSGRWLGGAGGRAG